MELCSCSGNENTDSDPAWPAKMPKLTKKACLDEKHDKGDFNFSPVGVAEVPTQLVYIASKGCVNELAITQPLTLSHDCPCAPPTPSLVANNCVLYFQAGMPAASSLRPSLEGNG